MQKVIRTLKGAAQPSEGQEKPDYRVKSVKVMIFPSLIRQKIMKTDFFGVRIENCPGFAVQAGFAGFLHDRSSSASYSIDWYKKFPAVGGTSTGGVYSVSGTIGQHDACWPMTGGAYAVTGGFCALRRGANAPRTRTHHHLFGRQPSHCLVAAFSHGLDPANQQRFENRHLGQLSRPNRQ